MMTQINTFLCITSINPTLSRSIIILWGDSFLFTYILRKIFLVVSIKTVVNTSYRLAHGMRPHLHNMYFCWYSLGSAASQSFHNTPHVLLLFLPGISGSVLTLTFLINMYEVYRVQGMSKKKGLTFFPSSFVFV